MEIKKILVPVDGSKYNYKALNMARSMVEQFNCKVILLNVIEINSIYNSDMLTLLKEQGKKVLEEARQFIQPIETEEYCIFGYPADEIMKKAQESNVDLIVIAKRGLTGLDKYLMGSIASKVVKHSKTPVLVIP
ncbi:MAG: universal stress protein [Epulopiscium sp.]|nr:universal stress protein [Candidatus Epulonipiscium sp.]